MARYSNGLRERSAKPVFVSSNLTLASIKFSERNLVKDLGEDYEYFFEWHEERNQLYSYGEWRTYP